MTDLVWFYLLTAYSAKSASVTGMNYSLQLQMSSTSNVETEAGLVQVGLGEVVVLHVLAKDLLN